MRKPRQSKDNQWQHDVPEPVGPSLPAPPYLSVFLAVLLNLSLSLCVSVSCALALSLSLLCSHCHKVSLIRVSCWQSRTRVFVVSLYLPCLESCLCPERMSFALQSWQLRASLSQQPSRCPPPNPYPAYDHQHQLFFHPRRQFICLVSTRGGGTSSRDRQAPGKTKRDLSMLVLPSQILKKGIV